MPDYSMPPDERPADMAELARLTAIELRKRGIWTFGDYSPFVWVGRLKLRDKRIESADHCYSLLASDFDNLGPSGCADVIQAEEARKAQEWAGDA